MLSKTPSALATGLSLRFLAMACAAIALLAGLAILDAPPTASAEILEECSITDLGAVGGEIHRVETEGRWTTEDCDSAFLPNSDAHTYRFELTEDGQVRIDLTSPEGDSYAHLIAEDGSRVAHDDDGGHGLDSRIEADLTAGSYRVEASQGSGRARGPADFTLTIRHVTTCGAVDLGVLEAGESLTQEGTWTVNDCRARYRDDTPAQTFRFQLAEEGLVRIDLSSGEGGDPFLYLLSAEGAYIQSDDDGGTFPNSRIESDLAAGTYLLEATTYGGRDHIHLLTDFSLTLAFVAPDAFQLKTEALHIPEVVIAGDPFTVHYRVGNLGHGDLPPEHFAIVLSAAHNGNRASTGPVFATGGAWSAGTSYHSGTGTATTTSATHPALSPMRITIREPGPSWVALAIIALDPEENDVGYHQVERRLMVLSGPPFDPVTVSVAGTDYSVEASTDEDGIVTTTVASVADANAEVDALTVAKATYAAGVRALVLDDIFESPGLAGLIAAGDPLEVSLANGSSSTLLAVAGQRYAEAVAESGIAETFAAGEAVDPLAVEDLVLRLAEKAARQYASFSASWSALQDQAASGSAISFTDAFALQAQIAYAERLLAPVMAAGHDIRTVRSGSMTSAVFPELVASLTGGGSCDGPALLDSALRHAGVEEIDALLDLDVELRGALSIFGEGSDAALCGAASVDAEHAAFLQRLGIENADLAALSAPVPAPEPEAASAAPEPHRLRIIAVRGADGRIQHGVELASGERIRPPGRFLPASTPADQWYVSGDVEVEGMAIGQIRARRLADGRIEVGFRDAYGETIAPDVLFWPADLPLGRWVRSSAVDVPRPPMAEESTAP